MNERVYRILRQQPDGDWEPMVSVKGKSLYKTLGAARGALTQYRGDHWNADRVFKIQDTLVYWMDVE